MRRDGLIRLNPKKEIELTEQGRPLAETIVRRHRIIERWLTDALGLDWVVADEEAARLEHAISEVVEQALWQRLNRPTTCPHGNPLPGISERDPREIRLSTLSPGVGASISRISEVAEREAPQLLNYLGERRLVPRTNLEVLEIDPVAQTMRLRAAEREVIIGLDTASRVSVVPID
ncbi:MAG: metal-dependent transcriptional regulator, partial [Candidatus Dormibacteraceae bacterium]